mmetsp:Transcript_9711/g.26476  ORF Transcript_9711/g.26476 Transcript_9711/m.26476 type:complete len:127 (+) Transcript_9711:1126-1506(+)
MSLMASRETPIESGARALLRPDVDWIVPCCGATNARLPAADVRWRCSWFCCCWKASQTRTGDHVDVAAAATSKNEAILKLGILELIESFGHKNELGGSVSWLVGWLRSYEDEPVEYKYKYEADSFD